MIPLYGFVEGDTLGLLVLAREEETVAELTARIRRAASLRVAITGSARLRRGEQWLAPERRLRELGLLALERIDVVVES